MLRIAQVDRIEAQRLEPQLVDLLIDAVNSGASVGFLAPLDRSEAKAYWQGVLAEIGPHLLLLVAIDDDGLAGSVQLHPASRANGRHRAEVAKLLVLQRARRRGIGAALMATLERTALDLGRTLLILDTRTGDDAERLYTRFGWTRFGIVERYVRDRNGVMTDTSFFSKELG